MRMIEAVRAAIGEEMERDDRVLVMGEDVGPRYRSNGDWSVPIVIRTPFGGGVHGGLYHSQSIEAFYAHVPGLKVVVPSMPADAHGLLKSAIRDPDPVLFLEHKKVYRL